MSTQAYEFLVEAYSSCGDIDEIRALVSDMMERKVIVTPRLCCAVLNAFSRRHVGLNAISMLQLVDGWDELRTVGSVAALLIEVFMFAGLVRVHVRRVCPLSVVCCCGGVGWVF
jgi:pentatricopeptide repeat protein